MNLLGESLSDEKQEGGDNRGMTDLWSMVVFELAVWVKYQCIYFLLVFLLPQIRFLLRISFFQVM